MSRFLLTLLALLSGLVAQSVPAQARIGGAAGAVATAQLVDRVTRAVVARPAASRPDAAIDWAAGMAPVVTRALAIQPRTVLHGIDRARE